MQIDNLIITASCEEVLTELRAQLMANKINLLRDVKSTPGNVMVTCPYHKGGQERRPSAGIKEDTGVFHCFTCGETHSLPEVISYCFGRYDDKLGAFGLDWLVKNFVSVAIEQRAELHLDMDRNAKKKEVKYVSEEELDTYRYNHPYWAKRKITNPDLIELFDLGYDKATRCITFPVRDEKGNCLFVARRSVDKKFFNYPAGVDKPVYGLYEYGQVLEKFSQTLCRGSSRSQVKQMMFLQNLQTVIICESMIDALTCWQYGFYAVALNGLGNELQFDQLNRMPCRSFVLATDMDDAGRQARERLKRRIKGKLVYEYRWDVNTAKDINDMSEEQFKSLALLM